MLGHVCAEREMLAGQIRKAFNRLSGWTLCSNPMRMQRPAHTPCLCRLLPVW
jgi:hypothetical protein